MRTVKKKVFIYIDCPPLDHAEQVVYPHVTAHSTALPPQGWTRRVLQVELDAVVQYPAIHPDRVKLIA